MDGSRGGIGVRYTPPPPKNHKNIGFLSNTGPDSLKNHTATKPAFNVGPSSPFHHYKNGGPLIAHLYTGIWTLIHSSTKKKIKVGPPLTKLSGSAHAFHLCILTFQCFGPSEVPVLLCTHNIGFGF